MVRARVLLLHGPNLNRLGRRDPSIYGTASLPEIEGAFRDWAARIGIEVVALQSNHEGALIDALQGAAEECGGAVVNLGALTHTSYALHDALLDFGKPVVEVHLSRVSEREPWRRVSVIRPACAESVEGLGLEGYRIALERLLAQMAAADERVGEDR